MSSPSRGQADRSAASDQIDRIVDEIRAELAAHPDEDLSNAATDGSHDEDGGSNLTGWQRIGAVRFEAPLTVRPGPLAPAKRLVKRLAWKATRVPMETMSADIRQIARLRESEVAEDQATIAELRREIALLRERLARVERDARAPRSAQAAPVTEPSGEVAVTGSAPSDVQRHLDYFSFEGLMRGSVDEIEARQSDYVALMSDVDDILDIGCGRGELLHLLAQNGKHVRGVDLNADMVARCVERGLDVAHADGITYLTGVPEGSLGAVVALQVVEHLPPQTLVRFLELCHRSLRSGGVLLLETINPVSLSALRNYFADLTHAQPVVAETLAFLAESAGFKEIRIEPRSPLPEVARLRHIALAGALGDEAQAQSDRNVDLLNAALFGPQDYALIASA